MSTPSSPFETHPASVFARASRNTNGRNPTPCTTPRTFIEHALILDYSPTMQPRPCHPIRTTLPSSTSTGTVRWPPESARILSRAARSASTSYSTKSSPRHSSHSRISCVCWQPAAPNSSSLATVEDLHRFADYVIHGRLHFLNTRNVVGMNHDRKIREPTAQNLSAVVAQQRHGEHPAFSCFFEGDHNIARTAARRDSHGHVVRLGLRDELAQKNQIRANVVGNRADVRRLKRQRYRRHRAVACWWRHAIDCPVICVSCRSAISENNELAAVAHALAHRGGYIRNLF